MTSMTHKNVLELGRPRSFTGLMALYESNYQRLARLVPEIDFPFDQAVSRTRRDTDLHLRVLERCKYTTDVHLTYWFEDAQGSAADPDVLVRVYHDAGLAEALRCGPHLPGVDPRGLDLESGSHMERRWARNLLLNKWLAFCLIHGHGFATAERPRLPLPSDARYA